MSGSAVVRLREKGASHVMCKEIAELALFTKWRLETDSSGPTVRINQKRIMIHLYYTAVNNISTILNLQTVN